MEDIASAPDYGGPIIIILTNIILTMIALVLAFQKINFYGKYATEVGRFIAQFVILSMFIIAGLFFVRWLVKSIIVRYVCGTEADWDLKTAISITGYAYFADVIVSVIGLFLLWYLLPTITINMDNLQTATQTLNDYAAQFSQLKLIYTLPISLFGLLWKSYLGGLGAHFGTKEKCSLKKGIITFLILSSIGIILSYVI